MKKLLFVLGTRPEVIKLAPVIKAAQAMPEQFETVVCATSQHVDMQNQMLERFGIVPDVDLKVMQPNQDLYHITTAVLNGMKSVLSEYKPDVVLVQGDTTTTFAASLAAYYQQIDVAHIEAGLRTHQRYSPFPEELNRALTGRLARFHFPPTKQSKENLLKEGIPADSIFVTGNTVIDALFWIKERLDIQHVQTQLPAEILTIARSDQPYILITGHRRESFGEGFLSICRAISELAKRYPDHQFIYPVHLNPNVRKPVFDLLKDQKNIHLIEPVDYEAFVYLMDHAYLVLTDSGGVQEEAPSLGKPVLVMRETTERPEGIAAGTALLVGTSEEKIVKMVSSFIDDKALYERTANIANPYGDGRAAQRILNALNTQ